MRVLAYFTCILLMAFLAVMPIAAQSRGDSGGNAGRGVADAGAAGAATSSSSSYSTGSSSYVTASYSGDVGRAFTGGSSSGIIPASILVGSSFGTSNLYYDWNNYYSYLYRYYSLSPTYFVRFMKNCEPLMTPAMLRITLRQPLYLSSEMLKLIEQLQMMYADMEAGNPVDKESFIAKSQMIRSIARQIRRDRTLSMIDIRKETDLFKNNDSALNAETINELRDMALGLVRQLNEMYSLTASSTISVDSYAEPSFASVTKGIEKACKAIEKSSKRL